MSTRWEWSGLEELKAALRQLPSELAGEAANLIEGATNSAEQRIKAGYPRRTGDLADHVDATVTRTAYGAEGIVRNRSKLAHIFEGGTQARHTALGANRGTMPAGHVFVPVLIRERRRLADQLRALLQRHGFVVSGDAA